MKRLPLWLLWAVGIVSLLLAFSLNFTSRGGPAGDYYELQVGMASSPWLTWGHTKGHPPAGPVTVPPGLRLHLLSWSVLAGLVGTAALTAAARLPRTQAREKQAALDQPASVPEP